MRQLFVRRLEPRQMHQFPHTLLNFPRLPAQMRHNKPVAGDRQVPIITNDDGQEVTCRRTSIQQNSLDGAVREVHFGFSTMPAATGSERKF